MQEYTVTGKLSEDLNSIKIDRAYDMRRLLFPLKEAELEITITKFYRKRTLAQNRLIWGVFIPTIQAWMKETIGSFPSKEGLYAFLRINVVGHELVIETINGIDTPVVTGKHFSQMTTVEFAESIDKIYVYYQELGLDLPLPKGNNTITDFLKDE